MYLTISLPYFLAPAYAGARVTADVVTGDGEAVTVTVTTAVEGVTEGVGDGVTAPAGPRAVTLTNDTTSSA